MLFLGTASKGHSPAVSSVETAERPINQQARSLYMCMMRRAQYKHASLLSSDATLPSFPFAQYVCVPAANQSDIGPGRGRSDVQDAGPMFHICVDGDSNGELAADVRF